MGTKNTEEVRCINKATGKVKYFRRWFANDKNWQKSTGFVPQELPVMNGTLEKPKPINPPPDEPEPEFSIDFITTESEDVSDSAKEQTKPTAKPTGKKATKHTTK